MAEDFQPKFRRRAEARPDEILDAALTLFGRKGFARTTVDEIARAAGLSKGTVYLYFPSKEALLEGLVCRAVAPIAETAREGFSARGGHPRDTIRTVLLFVASRLEDEKTLAVPMLVLREAPNVPEISKIYTDQVLSRVMPALADLIADGTRRGLLRNVRPEVALRSLVGPMIIHLVLQRFFGIVPDPPISLRDFVDEHLEIVFGGLATEDGEGP